MRPLNNAGQKRRRLLSLSMGVALSVSVLVALALACSQDASVSRIASPTAQTQREPVSRCRAGIAIEPCV